MLLALLWACTHKVDAPTAEDSGDSNPVDSVDTVDSADTDDSVDTDDPVETGDSWDCTDSIDRSDTGHAEDLPTGPLYEGYPNVESAWATWQGLGNPYMRTSSTLLDVTGDGVTDVLTYSGHYGDRVDIHTSYAAGVSDAGSTVDAVVITGDYSNLGALARDLDGDDAPDLIVSSMSYDLEDPSAPQGKIAAFIGPGGWSAPWWEVTGAEPSVGFGDVACSADLDGDGVDEVYSDEFYPGTVYGFRPYAGGSVDPSDADVVWTGCSYLLVVCPGDLSGDGLDDLELGGDGVSYLVGGDSPSGNPAATAFATVIREDGFNDHLAADCDLDADGQLDLVTTVGPYPRHLSVIYGPASGTLDLRAPEWLGRPGSLGTIPGSPLCIGDATADGNPDIVMIAAAPNATTGEFLGSALLVTGPFLGESEIPDGPRIFAPTDSYGTEALALAPDLDADGIPELAFAAASDGGYSVYIINSSTWVSGADMR